MLSAFPHSHLLKILSCFYASEMGDRKVLSKGLRDTNPDKRQILYQCVCSASLLTVPELKAQGCEQNIYSTIPRISKEHQVCTKCWESISCLPRVVPSTVGKNEPDRSTPFFIMIMQGKHFITFGRPCSTFSHQLLSFFFPLAKENESFA